MTRTGGVDGEIIGTTGGALRPAIWETPIVSGTCCREVGEVFCMHASTEEKHSVGKKAGYMHMGPMMACEATVVYNERVNNSLASTKKHRFNCSSRYGSTSPSGQHDPSRLPWFGRQQDPQTESRRHTAE